MKLYEFQAKEVFQRFGIPVPRGQIATSPEEAAEAAGQLGRCVVKAQVHAGGRGKAGLVKLADTPQQAATLAAGMLGQTFKGYVVKRLLLEEALEIRAEYYLAISVDRSARRASLMLSAMGGVDIEQVAMESPEKIARLAIDPAYGPMDFQVRAVIRQAGLEPSLSRAASEMVQKLYRAFVACDASLAEINPLAVNGAGALLAADAKVEVDDNALYRQPDLAVYREEAEADPIEAEAQRQGIPYVHLEGEIGIIGNGAGLVMNTLDMVARHGGRPANFLDIGGGARAEQVRQALAIVLMDKNVKGILLNVFGGITRGDEVARGILEASRSVDLRLPMVVRMAGTRAAEGLEILKGTALIPAAGPEEAASKIVSLVKT